MEHSKIDLKHFEVDCENHPNLIVNRGKCYDTNPDGTLGKYTGERVIFTLPDCIAPEYADDQDDTICTDVYDMETDGIYITMNKTQAYTLAKCLLTMIGEE